MSFADLEMVAVPRNRVLHDLPVYASVATKLVFSSPLLQVEEVAEKLEGFRPS